jgi:chemotaxis response regulator CheB
MGPESDPRLTVLLVEDDDDIRALVRTRLDLDGRFTVVAEAWNGAHAVGQTKVHQPDVVVLDVLMPVLDGAKALPLIRGIVPRAAIITFSALPAEHPRVAPLRDSDGHVCKTETASLGDVLYAAWAARQHSLARR